MIGTELPLVKAIAAGGTAIPLSRGIAYKSTPPVFANTEALNEPWRSLFERITQRPTAELPAAHIVTLENATLYQNGYIRTTDGRIIAESITNAKNVTPPDMNAVKDMPGSLALLRKPGDNNFGHWLLELLPRIREFKASFPQGKLRFGIPAKPDIMQEIRHNSLAMMGVSPDDILLLDDRPQRFDSVSFVTSNSIHSHTHDHIGATHVADLLRQEVNPGRANRKLFVARNDTHKRRLTNQPDIINMLAKMGFETVYPETLDFKTQITLFSEARMIVGVSGAALTNILWSPPECEVFSLSPNFGAEFFFWDIACIQNQRFSFIFGDSQDPEKLGHSDFSINTDLLCEVLQAASSPGAVV